MNYVNKYYKGFSLVEIITATFVLGLVALVSYATFFSVMKLTTTSRNELEAYAEASRWLEEVEAAVDYDDLIAQDNVDLNNASSISREDYTNPSSTDFWPFANKPNVSNLQARYTTQPWINLGSGMNFRKVTIRVGWDETAQ